MKTKKSNVKNEAKRSKLYYHLIS